RGVVSADVKQMGEDVQCGHCDEIVSVPNSRLATGAVIGDFAILEELGRGGMGVVYLAHQISLDRPAALKILQDSYANNAEFVVNFIKEARAAAKLNHPHIVQAYAVGEDEGIFYYAMEYINGDTMKDVLKRDKIIPIDKAVTIIQQIGEALDCAWKEQKLIHRDIKPDNIILAKNNRAKLADLGLSRVAGDMDDENEEEVMGTPQYISPEHLTGAPMDIRSDIYSLGATFYQFVTGRFPYEGRTANEIARKHLEAALVPPQVVNPKVPEAIGQIIMKMMKKNINERYQDAEELVEDLRLFRRGKLSSTGAVPKVFSTRTRSIPKDKSAEDNDKAPLDADFPTTTTGNLKPLYTAVSTASTTTGLLFSDELEGTFRKPRKKLVIYSAITIVLIIMVGAALVWFYILPLGEEVEPVQTPAIPLPVQRTFRQEYLNAVNSMLAEYQSKKITVAMFLTKADAIIKEFPHLLPGKEKKAFKRLMDVYVPLDEKTRVVPAREKLRKEHLDAIAARRKKAETERLAAEKAAKDAEAGRIRQAKEAAERERQLALKRQEEKILKLKIEKRAADYKKSIEKKKSTLIYNFVEFALQKKYDAAEKMFADAAGEPARVKKFTTEEKKLAKDFAAYAENLRKAFKRGLAITRDFTVDNRKLIGMGIEFDRYKYGRITKSENDAIFIQMPDDEVKAVKFAAIKNYYLRKFFKIVVKKHNIKDDYFYYLLFNGFFDKNIAKYAEDDFWKKELENFELEYFKEKLKDAVPQVRQELEDKFGGLEAFRKAQKD
ncbi:MAG: protein kinase, partial [Victivallaceae bacterium]|nr:protein kinase [Victivallaceae bacterium]